MRCVCLSLRVCTGAIAWVVCLLVEMISALLSLVGVAVRFDLQSSISTNIGLYLPVYSSSFSERHCAQRNNTEQHQDETSAANQLFKGLGQSRLWCSTTSKYLECKPRGQDNFWWACKAKQNESVPRALLQRRLSDTQEIGPPSTNDFGSDRHEH